MGVKYELFDYHETAVAAISKHLIRATRDHDEDPDERTAVVLAAPTGAGKTVSARHVMTTATEHAIRMASVSSAKNPTSVYAERTGSCHPQGGVRPTC